MNAIIFDLELMKRFKKGQLSEIVEIGACKVDIHNRNIVDHLQIYISPKRGISKSTRKFIKMTEEDVANAVSYQEGIKIFKDWLGEDYYLCAWGKDDKFHLLNQCLRYHMNLNWLRNYNDIQIQISRLLKAEHALSLKSALALLNIVPTGKAHRGIDDAFNTAELFLRFQPELNLQTNEVTAAERAKHLLKKRKRSFQGNRSIRLPDTTEN
ncbi:3'-5' exonuclease [Bacillus solitudinis]|uniref:3'-5' exonuclease n=1 Tax=Bacillus solitudinis TaxID=2014074 RepID=UPI000C23A3D5|nr:3'-5' exonuclease [Bacillus solitudinis]